MNRNAIRILISILLFCLVMALVERVIQPGYAVKSIIKLTLCLVMTGTLCGFRGILRREGLGTGLASLLPVLYYLLEGGESSNLALTTFQQIVKNRQ